MIRVIIEHQSKDTENLMNVLREVRTEAMKQRGYITGETLVDSENPSSVIVITTWQTPEDWELWDTCDKRKKLNEKINPLLTEPYKVRVLRYYLVPEIRGWYPY